MSDNKTAIKSLNGHPLTDLEARTELSRLETTQDSQNERIVSLENAAGLSSPYLGDLTRVPAHPCPIIYFEGDESSMTKEDAVLLKILIVDEYGRTFFSGFSETTWQGSGSLSYPNKNLSLKLKDANGEKAKISIFSDYATHSYHLKCNYMDYSMVRNSVGAQLAHEFDDTVFPVDAPITVKSMPVIVYKNGEFQGCYTLNYKQDDKLFGMDSETNNLTEIVYRSGNKAWDISNFEYRSDGAETDEVKAKIQAIIDFGLLEEGRFMEEFDTHFVLNNVINYWLYADIACASDSLLNNWTLATWDGQKWYMCWYDMDIIFGMLANANNATQPNQPDTNLLTAEKVILNPIWEKFYRLYFNQIRERYWELRNGIANPTELVSRFRNFQRKWTSEYIAMDRAKWTGKNHTTADVDNMYSWIVARLAHLDEKYSMEE